MNTFSLSQTFLSFILLLSSLVSIMSLKAQKTDCDDNEVRCDRDKKYPYAACPGPGTVCAGYTDIPIQGVRRVPSYPPCFVLDIDNFHTIPKKVYMPSQNGNGDILIFDGENRDVNITSMYGDMFMARQNIACICGYPRSQFPPPCNCAIKIRFSFNDGDFINPDDPDNNPMGRTVIFKQSSTSCSVDCNKTVIFINVTRKFTNGDDFVSIYPKNFFFNGDIAPANVEFGRNLFSFNSLIEHEMLHVLGLKHYDGIPNCGGDYNGLMNSTIPQTLPNKHRPRLLQDDYCAVALLYCGTIVPVEQEPSFVENTDIKVFPNPVSSVLNIELTNDEKACIKSYYVVDIHGREVLSGLLPSASLHSINVPLNMSVLPNGTYFLLMTSSKREQIRSVKFEVYK